MTGAVLITGSAKRIGRSIALDLAGAGWAVVVHYHGAPDDADSVVKDIRGTGGNAISVESDLSDIARTETLIGRAADALGRPLTALVNNASIFEKDEIDTLTAESWQRHHTVNLMAPVLLSQAFARQLPDGKNGNIINIIDQRVWKPNPQFMSYTASKAGLWAMTRTLAQALAPRIRVNGIGPGPTLMSIHQTTGEFAHEASSVPLGHGPRLEEICRGVRFLLESPSVTGQMIALDGGQHLAWQTADLMED